MTSATIGTRIGSTIVDVLFAMGTNESRETVALVIRNEVNAGATVLARIDGTIINVGFAMRSSESCRADALVLSFVFGIHKASASILARSLHAASVNFDIAVDSGESRLATALVSLSGVLAIGIILARIVGTSFGLQFAMNTMKAKGTNTSIIVDTSALASTTIDTKVVRALIGDPDFAVGTSPSRRARTSVRSLTGVEASSSILARPVVGTVVQVLVTEKATPAFLTMASPGLIASSMLASWVSDAFIAIGACPTISASERREEKG